MSRHKTHAKDMMQLYAIYGGRDIKQELKFMSKRISPNYLTRDDADFIRWLCHAALKRIEELENK